MKMLYMRQHGDVRAWSFESDGWREFKVLERIGAGPDSVIGGPAIILEPTSTTYLDAGHTARVHETGCLVITREES